jgi:uncharacterized phage protein (TIGR02218 family)/uncharacterized protein (TIGR02217 family)
MPQNFIDHRLSTRVSNEFRRVVSGKTDIVPMLNGSERRNAAWAYKRLKFSASFALLSDEAREELVGAFYAANAQLLLFRFRDAGDYRAVDTPIVGAVAGTKNTIQLTRRYTFGSTTVDRKLQAIGKATIKTAGGVVVAGTLSTTLGTFTPTDNWAAGQHTWSGTFDCWVRFASDDFDVTMPRNVPIPIKASLASAATTLCAIVKIIPRQPGYATYGVTTLDHDIQYDTGDGLLNYSARIGTEPSALVAASDLSVAGGESKQLMPMFDTPVSEADMAAGAYDYARFEAYLIDYKRPEDGHTLVQTGTLGRNVITDSGLAWTTELRGLTQRLKQSVTEKWSLSCRARFGSQPGEQKFFCGFNVSPLWQSGTVTAVGTDTTQEFTSSGLAPVYGGVPGMVRWFTGRNAGRTDEAETFVDDAGEQTIGLTFGAMFPIEIGDEFEFRDDCSKTPDACKERNNWPRYRGEPTIPVSDAGVISAGSVGGFAGAIAAATPTPTPAPTPAPTPGPTPSPTPAPTPAPSGPLLLHAPLTADANDIIDPPGTPSIFGSGTITFSGAGATVVYPTYPSVPVFNLGKAIDWYAPKLDSIGYTRVTFYMTINLEDLVGAYGTPETPTEAAWGGSSFVLLQSMAFSTYQFSLMAYHDHPAKLVLHDTSLGGEYADAPTDGNEHAYELRYEGGAMKLFIDGSFVMQNGSSSGGFAEHLRIHQSSNPGAVSGTATISIRDLKVYQPS